MSHRYAILVNNGYAYAYKTEIAALTAHAARKEWLRLHGGSNGDARDFRVSLVFASLTDEEAKQTGTS